MNYENAEQEAIDADTVKNAIDIDDMALAEQLLLSVIQNTPDNYSSIIKLDKWTNIKFWELEDFLHFATFKSEYDQDEQVNWQPNAYPKAYYQLGYLYVQNEDYERAIFCLDKAISLEPYNPKPKNEKAIALLKSCYNSEAYALYDEINTIGPFVSEDDLACSLRGRGFLLIENQQLDEAESLFRESLIYNPDNSSAYNELEYIDSLRNNEEMEVTTEVFSPQKDDEWQAQVEEQPKRKKK